MSMRSGASVCQLFVLISVPRGARTGRAPGSAMVVPFVLVHERLGERFVGVTSISVSYTHLDVYKRQVKGSA